VDWVALGGIAQGLAALATVALALVTVSMANETREVAKAARDETAATISLAQEARNDRELAWRPQMSLVDIRLGDGVPPSPLIEVRVKNAGGGPAIKCKVAIRQPGRWWLIAVGDLQVNSEASGIGSPQSGARPDEVFTYVSQGAGGLSVPLTPELVILCSDVLGRQLRFPVQNSFDGIGAWNHLRPEVSAEEVPKAKWATEPALFW
jgi:hypothetical protein